VLVDGIGTGALASGNDEANRSGSTRTATARKHRRRVRRADHDGAGDGSTVIGLPAGDEQNNSRPASRSTGGVHQTVAQNEISNNGGLGIDLAPAGVTWRTIRRRTPGSIRLNFPNVSPGGAVSLSGN
jgi:hypothetical protein